MRVNVRDMQDALREIRPSAMREVAIEVPKVYKFFLWSHTLTLTRSHTPPLHTYTQVLWRDIGGQEEVKQRMREAVEWPLKHPEVLGIPYSVL